MGVDYSAQVFFGAFVDKRTALGQKLEAYIDIAGGAPADTEIPGVQVAEVGSYPTGETWLVVMAAESNDAFSEGDEIGEPVALTEDPAWRPALDALFARLKVKKRPVVGWYFATSAS